MVPVSCLAPAEQMFSLFCFQLEQHMQDLEEALAALCTTLEAEHEKRCTLGAKFQTLPKSVTLKSLRQHDALAVEQHGNPFGQRAHKLTLGRICVHSLNALLLPL